MPTGWHQSITGQHSHPFSVHFSERIYRVSRRRWKNLKETQSPSCNNCYLHHCTCNILSNMMNYQSAKIKTFWQNVIKLCEKVTLWLFIIMSMWGILLLCIQISERQIVDQSAMSRTTAHKFPTKAAISALMFITHFWEYNDRAQDNRLIKVFSHNSIRQN